MDSFPGFSLITARTLSTEGGINYARQAFNVLNSHYEFPGKFMVERPGKDGINLVHRKINWITPNTESK